MADGVEERHLAQPEEENEHGGHRRVDPPQDGGGLTEPGTQLLGRWPRHLGLEDLVSPALRAGSRARHSTTIPMPPSQWQRLLMNRKLGGRPSTSPVPLDGAVGAEDARTGSRQPAHRLEEGIHEGEAPVGAGPCQVIAQGCHSLAEIERHGGENSQKQPAEGRDRKAVGGAEAVAHAAPRGEQQDGGDEGAEGDAASEGGGRHGGDTFGVAAEGRETKGWYHGYSHDAGQHPNDAQHQIPVQRTPPAS